MQSEVIGLHKNQILSQRAVKYLTAHQGDTYRASYLELLLLLRRQELGYLFHLCAPVACPAYFIMLLLAFTLPRLSEEQLQSNQLTFGHSSPCMWQNFTQGQ